MPVREGPPQKPPPPKEPAGYPAEEARGGRAVLRTPTRMLIFVAGLAVGIVLLLVIPLIA